MDQFLQKRLSLSLLLLRLGVLVVMGIWVIDKFVNPDHTARVYATFYFIPNLDLSLSYVIGVVQGLIVLAFALGLFKRVSYGLVLVMHTISTLTPMARYFAPWEGLNILFFAAWPMLAALVVLYLLRDYDTYTLGKGK